MADGLQIQIENYSSIEWTRNNWGVGAGQSDQLNWTDELTNTPAEKLARRNGMTKAAADQKWLKDLVRDALYLRLGYGSGDGNFAVLVQEQFHLVGLGSGCVWQVWDNADNAWKNRGSDSSQYTWTFAHCKVVATPTLSNTEGSIAIVITDLPK